MNRHSTFFIEDIKRYTFCGNEYYELEGSMFELPVDTLPTTGIHDFNDCVPCKDNHKAIYENAKITFEQFPLCCKLHTNLTTKKWFDKNAFGNVPLQYANKYIFTIQHIINNISNENWYKEITDYIDYTIKSFGQMPKDCGEPLFISGYLKDLKEHIIRNKDSQPEKSNKIIEYLNAYLNTSENQKIELNVLLSIYQTWLNIFPFEISYFKDLKQQFEKQIPILKGKPEYNPYAKLSKAKLQTKSGLINTLITTTKILLQKINTTELFRKNLITDAKAHTFSLIVENHRIKQLSLLGDFSKGEREYIDVLQNWLLNEKELFHDIMPLMANMSNQKDGSISSSRVVQNKETKERKNITVLKSFPEFLLHESRAELAKKLKDEFTADRGKSIRLLIEVLKSKAPRIINDEDRNGKAIYNAMKKFFDRDIGSYQSIFDYPYDVITNKPDFEAIEERVDFVLNSIIK